MKQIELPAGQYAEMIIDEYVDFLCKQRGLLEYSARKKGGLTGQRLLEFLGVKDASDLRNLQATALHEYLTRLGRRYARVTMSGVCSQLRGFLRHLYRRHLIDTDLSRCILSPRVYKHEGCPRFLTHTQIIKVLDQIDRDTHMGIRDYAILLLLAIYGLRAGEVVKLSLDDFDWRRDQLHVRKRKAGNSTVYPLIEEVGEAILVYLETVRPNSEHRRLFLCSPPPHAPLQTSSTVTGRSRHYIRKA